MIKTEKVVATDIVILTVLLKDTSITYNILAIKKNPKKLQESKIQFTTPFMLNFKKKNQILYLNELLFCG